MPLLRGLSRRTRTGHCWSSSADPRTKRHLSPLLFQSWRRHYGLSDFSAQPSSRSYYHFLKNSIFRCIHPRDSHATVRRNEVLAPPTTRVSLSLGEVREASPKRQCYRIPFIWKLVNIPKGTELCTSNGWSLWYVNYISVIKLWKKYQIKKKTIT